MTKMAHDPNCTCFFRTNRERVGFVSTRIAGTDGVSENHEMGPDF
ncbi:MAG: hypothetical protein R2874_10390 [Desulfobacterales bacterium]